MTIRLAAFVIVIVCLAGLIVYSQVRQTTLHVSGVIEADEIRVGSRVGGRIARVNVQEGQEVDENQILLELEPFDLLEREQAAQYELASREAEYQRLANGLRDEKVAQAKADLDRLNAKLASLEAGSRRQEIEAARARVKAAESERKLAETVYKRHADLVQNKALSRAEFERTTEAFEAAQSLVVVREKELELVEIGPREEEKAEARAAVESAKQVWLMAKSGFRDEEIAAAKAARDAAQANLEAIGQQRKELLIRSPVRGVVDSLDLQPGDMIAAGAPTLSIVDHRKLWVRTYVPQNRVGLQVGNELRVTVDSLPDAEFKGRISFIARQAEFTPSNVQTLEERSKQVFRVKVMLDDTDASLRPGMSADVWLEENGQP